MSMIAAWQHQGLSPFCAYVWASSRPESTDLLFDAETGLRFGGMSPMGVNLSSSVDRKLMALQMIYPTPGWQEAAELPYCSSPSCVSISKSCKPYFLTGGFRSSVVISKFNFRLIWCDCVEGACCLPVAWPTTNSPVGCLHYSSCYWCGLGGLW